MNAIKIEEALKIMDWSLKSYSLIKACFKIIVPADLISLGTLFQDLEAMKRSVPLTVFTLWNRQKTVKSLTLIKHTGSQFKEAETHLVHLLALVEGLAAEFSSVWCGSKDVWCGQVKSCCSNPDMMA